MKSGTSDATDVTTNMLSHGCSSASQIRERPIATPSGMPIRHANAVADDHLSQRARELPQHLSFAQQRDEFGQHHRRRREKVGADARDR